MIHKKTKRWNVIEPGWYQLSGTTYEITYNEIKKNYTLWFGTPEHKTFCSLKKAKLYASKHNKKKRKHATQFEIPRSHFIELLV